MLSAVIIDDEETAIQVLVEMLTNISSIKVKIAGTALNLKAGVEIIKMTRPDIVFLDINMPGKNGLEIYNEFKCPDFKIIFCSAHPQYAFDVLKKAACGYLLKPIDLLELENALRKVQYELNHEQKQLMLEDKINFLNSPVMKGDNILLEVDNGFIIGNSRNIEYCYAKNANSVVVMQTQKEYEVTKSLKELEEILPSSQFYRTHKSYLANIYYIRKFVHAKENYVLMESGVKVPVSVRITTVISRDIKNRMLV
jgi:two-component system, LytTR family, response regulator